MMIRWGIYLAFVVLMVYESVIYENVAVSMLMAAAIFLPVISLVLLAVARRKINITMKIPVPVAEKNNPIQLQIDIKRGDHASRGANQSAYALHFCSYQSTNGQLSED